MRGLQKIWDLVQLHLSNTALGGGKQQDEWSKNLRLKAMNHHQL